MIIYEATNKINGKKYIGQTRRSLEERIKAHLKHAKSGGNLHYFQKAINKYGIENFEWNIICEAKNLNEANELEIYYIAKFETNDPLKGYNETIGGSGVVGNVLTEEQRKQISDAVKASEKFQNFCKSYNATEGKSKTMKGREFSEKHRKNLSEAAKNRELSEEGRKKLSKAMQNSEDHKKAMQSEEYRKKQADITREKWKDPEFRRRMINARKKQFENAIYNSKKCIECGNIEFEEKKISPIPEKKSELIEEFKYGFLSSDEQALLLLSDSEPKGKFYRICKICSVCGYKK